MVGSGIERSSVIHWAKSSIVINCTGLHKMLQYDEVKCDDVIKSEILSIESGQMSFLAEFTKRLCSAHVSFPRNESSFGDCSVNLPFFCTGKY